MVGGVGRSLRVFLCHASGDKSVVREFYRRLVAEGVDAWLDQEKLLPGQDWRVEIPRAVEEADVVVVFLSNKSITKEGYVQKEIKFALDVAEEKPEGTIFLIPARIEECAVPERLSRWQWVDLYEENGLIKLLRSLKRRADAVGATVEPTSYEESDREIERRVKQLYTEGLAAFYTEDWDRACQRFRTILSEHPNHKNAAEKLAEAERQGSLAKSYVQAVEAVRSENWQAAIKTLEGLSQKSTDYKDVVQLLRNARRQKQLEELYTEAKTLYAGEQWQAVVKVFEQISVIEPACPDADGLLASAQKKMAELKRLADLNDLYSNAVGEMDTGHWYEARRLLEQVHKAQTGFLETERLLRKTEDEITKVEENNKRNDQVNVLYEQAHGLLRSKKWRKALDKLEEIEGLESHFEDKDDIAQKARAELEREDREAQRQNQLAAMYAEAVRLLKEEKYQEALDRWEEVKAADPKYPDRQWVRRTARKRLMETSKPTQTRPRLVKTRSLWMGIAGFVVITFVMTGVILSGKGNHNVLPISTRAPTESVIENPTATEIADNTSTPRPATPVSAISGYADPTMYDDFDIPEYDGKYNAQKWGIYTDPSSGGQNNGYVMNQSNGQLIVGVINGKGNLALGSDEIDISQPTFAEARLYLDPATTDNGTHLYFHLGYGNGLTTCGIFSIEGKPNRQEIKCWSVYPGENLELNTGKDNIEAGWHILRFEIYPNPFEITSFIDGLAIGKFSPKESIPEHYDEIRNSIFHAGFGMHNFGSAESPVGYIDYVRVGAIEDDPTVYDNFNDSSYDGEFDVAKWAYEERNKDGSIVQQDGVMIFTQNGISQSQVLRASKFWPYELQNSVAFEANLKSDMTSDGSLVLRLSGDIIESVSCGLHTMSDFVMAHCWERSMSSENAIPVGHGTWHTVRLEISLETNTITFFIDGKKLMDDHYERSLKGSEIYLDINVSAMANRVNNTRPMVGYVDDVRVLPLDYINP